MVSHVTTVVDEQIVSQQSTVTFYRFLERFGHVLGPLLVGQVLMLAATGFQALLWLATGLIIFAVIFQFVSRPAGIAEAGVKEAQ